MPGSKSLTGLSVLISCRYYAVISVRSNPEEERLVVAYPDEKSLRGLIAAPSILALGYRSRAEAVARLEGSLPTNCALLHESETGGSSRVEHRGADSANCWASKVRFDLASIRRRISHLVHYGVAVAIGLLYSQNFVSATLRALVSS